MPRDQQIPRMPHEAARAAVHLVVSSHGEQLALPLPQKPKDTPASAARL